MARDLASIRAKIKPRHTTVWICLDGELQEHYEQLAAQLDSLVDEGSLAGPSAQAAAIAAEMDELRKQIEDAREPFRLKSPSFLTLSNLQALVPDRSAFPDEQSFRTAHLRWTCELLSACLVDPVATADELLGLSEDLAGGDWLALHNKAIEITSQASQVPTMPLAFERSPGYGERLKQPEPSESAAPSSLADPQVSGPPSDETLTAGSPAG